MEDLLVEVRKMRRELRQANLLHELTLDGKVAAKDDWTDPIAFFMPKKWCGPSFRGQKFSQCPAEYLEMLAKALDFIALKERDEKKMFKGKPSWVSTHRNATLARRWAYRKRCGWMSTDGHGGNGGGPQPSAFERAAPPPEPPYEQDVVAPNEDAHFSEHDEPASPAPRAGLFVDDKEEDDDDIPF